MDSGDESDHYPISTEMLEDIRDGIQSHPNVNSREAMAMRPSVTYTHCVTSLRKKTGDIIMFTHFEEGNMLTKNRNDA